MSVKVIIDNREKSFIDSIDLNFKDFVYNKQNLDIGDFHFYIDETIALVIERKTLNDLSCSIKDGRYREQRARMLEYYPSNVRKLYLIEGSQLNDFKLNSKIFYSSLINMMLRDNILIYRTDNLDDSIEFIIKIFKQLEKIGNKIVNNDTSKIDEIGKCKPSKKGNITQKVCFQNQLMQIPGISSKTAESLINKYSNMKYLIEDMCFDAKEDVIDKLSIIKVGKKDRSLGKKISLKIYHYLIEQD